MALLCQQADELPGKDAGEGGERERGEEDWETAEQTHWGDLRALQSAKRCFLLPDAPVGQRDDTSANIGGKEREKAPWWGSKSALHLPRLAFFSATLARSAL